MTTQKFFTEIHPILESWMKAYKKTNNAALGESLERYLSKYEQLTLPDDIKAVLDDFRKEKNKIDNPSRIVSFIKNHKKIVGCATLATLLTTGAVFALDKSNSKDAINASENLQTMEIDVDYWSRSPLTGETLIQEGIAIKTMLADNGLFEEGKFSNDELAFYAFMGGIEAKTDSRIASLKLSEVVADKTVAETMLDKRTQTIETGLMTKEFKADWSKIYPKRYEANILNELQQNYENVLANDTAENRQAINQTLDKILNNSTGFGEEASLDIIAYVNAFRGLGAQTEKNDNSYITEEKHDNFVDYMYQNCLNIDNKSAEFIQQQHSLYDDVKTKVLEKIESTLKLEKTTKAKSDGDKSLKEISIEISKAKVENRTFDGMTAGEKASEESKKDAQAAVERDYPGEKVSANDKIITDSKGNKVIDSGKTTVVDEVGDTKTSQNVDNNGNAMSESDKKTNAELQQMGANDYASGTMNEAYKNNSYYLQGWNAAKEAASQIDHSQKVEESTETKYNENANQSTTESVVTPPQTESNTSNEIVSEETKTEDVIWNNFLTGTDGMQYNITDIGTNPELSGRSR